MMQKLKSISLTVGTIAVVLFPTLLLTSASASAAISSTDISNNLCSGTNFDLTNKSQNCTANTSTSNFQTLLENIINIFTVVVGVVAVIMIIVGGLRYITSGGEASKVGGAKTTIIYALVGLVVVALAQLVVHFVLSQSASVTNGGN